MIVQSRVVARINWRFKIIVDRIMHGGSSTRDYVLYLYLFVKYCNEPLGLRHCVDGLRRSPVIFS